MAKQPGAKIGPTCVSAAIPRFSLQAAMTAGVKTASFGEHSHDAYWRSHESTGGCSQDVDAL